MNEEQNNNIGTVAPQQAPAQESVQASVAQTPAPTQSTGKDPIIVKGVDIRQYNAHNIPEDLVDEMTDEQAEKFVEGMSEEDTTFFNEIYGYIESSPLSDEELKQREEARQSMSLSFNHSDSAPGTQTSASEQQPESAQPVKTEQTGSVIFGQRS